MSADRAYLHAQWRSVVPTLQGPSVGRVLPAPLQVVPDARVSNGGGGVTLFPEFLVPFAGICGVLATRLKTGKRCSLERSPDSPWKLYCPLSSSVWMPTPRAPAPRFSLWNQRVSCSLLLVPIAL